MTTMLRCRGCYRLIREDDRFCPLCGKPQVEIADHPHRTRNYLLVTGLIVTALIAILVQWSHGSTGMLPVPTPTSTPLSSYFAPTATPTLVAVNGFAIGTSVIVQSDHAKIYSVPLDLTASFATLPSGYHLTISGGPLESEGHTYWWVSDGAGLNGYIDEFDIGVDGELIPTTAATITPTPTAIRPSPTIIRPTPTLATTNGPLRPGSIAIVATQFGYLHADSSTTSKILSTLIRGSRIRISGPAVISESVIWWPVADGAISGYMIANVLAPAA